MKECPRCGNESIIWLVTKKAVCCDRCRDFNDGIVPVDYTESDERVYQIKHKRD